MKFRNHRIGDVEILKNIYVTWGRFPIPHKDQNETSYRDGLEEKSLTIPDTYRKKQDQIPKAG